MVMKANVSRTNAFWQDASKPESRPWLRNLVNKTFDFQDNLTELGNSRKRIYDDGKFFALDLNSKYLD